MPRPATDKTPKNLDAWWRQLGAQERAELRSHYDNLLAKLADPRKQDLLWWHEVGTAVKELSDATKPRIGGGRSLLELIADKLEPGRKPKQMSAVTLLYKIRKFAIVYPKRKDAKDLAGKVKAGKLTIQHVSVLLGVDEGVNTKSREQFLQDCLAQGWSAARLQREIQDDRSVLTSRGGRSPVARTATNPAVAAREIENLARSWIAAHRAYFEDRGAPLSKMPDKCDPQLARELLGALESLRRVADRAAEGARILERIEKRLQASAAGK